MSEMRFRIAELDAENQELHDENERLQKQNKHLSSFLEEAAHAAAMGKDPVKYLATSIPTELRDQITRLQEQNLRLRKEGLELRRMGANDINSQILAKLEQSQKRVGELEEETGSSLADILHERDAQDAKWGEQNHDPFTYLTILMEEVGELAQAALHTRFGGNESGRMREEAVQTAAVAIAIVQCLDRDKWEWLTPPATEAEAKHE